MCDTERGYTHSVLCQEKGPRDKYAVKALAQFCDEFGSPTVIIQCDQESALYRLAEAAKVLRKSATILRFSPKASKPSQGYAERKQDG